MYSALTVVAVCVLILTTASSSQPCGRAGNEEAGVGRSLKHTEGCNVELGITYAIDHPMNNGNLPQNIVSTPEECCAMCGHTPGCKTWVMIRAKTQWNKKGACWLNDEVPEPTKCLVCAGGLAPRGAAKITPRVRDEECLFLPGMDFKNGDITRIRGVWSDTACCDLCKSYGSRCKAWTRVENGHCWLKYTMNTPSICLRCKSSGVIEQRLSSSDIRKLADILRIIRSKTGGDSKLRSEIDGFLNRVESLGD